MRDLLHSYRLSGYRGQAWQLQVGSLKGVGALVCRASKHVRVVRLPRSGGLVTRSPAARKGARARRVREYFYGPQGTLAPHSQTARLEDLRIFRVGGGPRAPSSALPLGTASF